jgi:molecular chaperone IbpA
MNTLARWERYSPVGIGLEEMFRRLDTFADTAATNYPPYNIKKLDENSQVLEIALAGFSKDDIEVAVEKGVLTVKASITEVQDEHFIHKGIASRNVARNWQLSDEAVVEDPTFVDGMLRIVIRLEVPEAQKRRLLPVS